jgi:ribosomal protein L25 (general stress protein Ctc)
MEAFWREQLKGSATKDLRIREAVMASLLGANGSPEDGAISVDLNRLTAVAAKGYRLEATAEATTLRVFVVDADGHEVKSEPRAAGYRDAGSEGGLEPGLASSTETG